MSIKFKNPEGYTLMEAAVDSLGNLYIGFRLFFRSSGCLEVTFCLPKVDFRNRVRFKRFRTTGRNESCHLRFGVG